MPPATRSFTLKNWLYVWAPSSTRPTSFTRVIWPPELFTMISANSSAFDRLPPRSTVSWKASPSRVGGAPIWPAAT